MRHAPRPVEVELLEAADRQRGERRRRDRAAFARRGQYEIDPVLLQRGAELSGATEPSVASLCLAVQTMVAVENEDWDTAGELTDRAERLVRDAGLSDYALSALVFAAGAAVSGCATVTCLQFASSPVGPILATLSKSRAR